MKNLLLLFTLLIGVYSLCITLFASCNESKNSSEKIEQINTDTSAALPIKTFDTTIVLTTFNYKKLIGSPLTDGLAKKILYQHFINKGCYTSDNLPDPGTMTEEEGNKLSVDYEGIIPIPLNNSKAAVISYWLTPPYANGNHWQPHHAIIAQTKTGYTICHEEFIPNNSTVDSIKTINGEITIFGYEYQLGTGKALQYFRIKLK